MVRAHKFLCLVIGWGILAVAVTVQAQDEADLSFTQNVLPVLREHCLDCHGPDEQESGLRLDSRRSLIRGGDSGEPAVVPGKPIDSYLMKVISGDDPDVVMPPDGDGLAKEHVDSIRQWILGGARMPEAHVMEDSVTGHWSLQPIAEIEPPRSEAASVANPIDAFVLKRLTEAQLAPSPRANRRTLIRRLYLVMHGLPPTPQQIERFANDDSAAAWQNLVDEVLDSPRYGERWARHWLDLIRFGETQGFETNRERPNAWPYRDWVINALNEDKPYDQFVREQIAGDALDEPIGTGFLVAGPHDLVQSPDINLTLMQRQDELSDLINTTGTAFLGLTLGCARCHNHKFDPITQRDFYSIQAIFAGVQHGERALPLSKEDQSRRTQVAQSIARLQASLQPFLPKANGGLIRLDDSATPGDATCRVDHLVTPAGAGRNPAGKQRGFADDPGSSSHRPNISGGQYTWWNSHPGQDVIAYRPNAEGAYRVWLSWGAGHATHTQDARYVLDRDGISTTCDDQIEIANVDQQQLADAQTDSDKVAPVNQALWSGLLNAGIHELAGSSVLFVRGGMTGSAITSDVLLLEPIGKMVDEEAPATAPSFRQPVRAEHNIESLTPVEAKFIRLTVLETNSSQPCIDELEVFAGETNVALAKRGAVATCSSSLPGYEIHQLQHVNDGLHGNSHSWISNEVGSGWVQIELPDTAIIDRVQWSRDREGRFHDRVATSYRIATSLDGVAWETVASSADRLPFGSDVSATPIYRFESVDKEVVAKGRQALAELERLWVEQQRLEQTTTVYAGTFTEPPPVHRLYRGDPTAKREEVLPNTVEALGTLDLTQQTPEQQRRLQFAQWITSPDNPLTARVMINRVWQFHFGTGIVATPSDFGGNGVPPSHPELLDWLAAEFMRQDWSLKAMHRLILLSETWQQDSRPVAAGLELDAGSQLLWRFPPRRLEAEAIRDSMLAVSGALDLTMGGPGFSGFEVELENVRHFFPKTKYGPEDYRRMIYMTMVRQERESVFGVFDCPDASQVVARRSRSTTPLQALNLLNSPFTIQQTRLLAKRLRSDAGVDLAAQVQRAYNLCYGRFPTPDEIAAASQFIEVQGLDQFCRALFNSNEFLFIP